MVRIPIVTMMITNIFEQLRALRNAAHVGADVMILSRERGKCARKGKCAIIYLRG